MWQAPPFPITWSSVPRPPLLHQRPRVELLSRWLPGLQSGWIVISPTSKFDGSHLDTHPYNAMSAIVSPGRASVSGTCSPECFKHVFLFSIR